jgi:glycosyltransferase involved in cell wall biosynthesis
LRLPAPVKRFIHDPHAIEGWQRPIATAIYRTLVAQELLLIRMLDALSRRPAGAPLLGEATVLIKTFERPHIVRRLVSSIRRLYPTLGIVVVDDSRDPVALEGVETVVMPYDSGVSAGRNEGLRHVTTKYVVVLDDDFVLFSRTRLAEALELMERHPEVDIMGGNSINLPLLTARPLPQAAGRIFATDREPLFPIGSRIGELVVCEKVPTFFVARRDRLALVGWDPALKRMDHADFFSRALGVLTTVFNPDFKAFHARTPFDADYMTKRLELAADRKVLREKYSGTRS